MTQTGIIIEVTGNTAKVTQKPGRITSGTIGLPVQFVFDSSWDALKKIAVFRAGDISRTVADPGEGATVPWEVLRQPNIWLYAGVCGFSEDGTVVIPTIWANVGAIQPGVDPTPAMTVGETDSLWQGMMGYFNGLQEKVKMQIAEISLPADAWEGAGGIYSQQVRLAGITAFSQVDLKPTPQQMARFSQLGMGFTTVNEGGALTVYAIGGRPVEDYTMEISITEVRI